jgi:hypothetical protein
MMVSSTFPKLRTIVWSAAIASLFLAGCDSCDRDPKPINDTPTVDTANQVVSVGGALFSIPSPVQTSMLIKETGAKYNNGMLNSAKNLDKYITKYKKALNVGVYGADVGYVTIYDNSQDALGYLKSIRKLSDELGILGAFDEKTINRFQDNLGKRDSMLSMVGDAYRASDAFLKDNDKKDIGVLILAGGWIETLYFTTTIAQSSNNPKVMERLGEQKYTLDNLIKALNPYRSQEEVKALLDQLYELAYDFDAVAVEYKYVKPTTDEANKITTINSTSKVTITKEHLKAISDKIAGIRNTIVG